MPLPMNLIWDIALAAVLLSILYASWRRGFAASLIRLVGTAAGVLLASLLSRPAAERLYGQFLEERVQRYVSENLLGSAGPLMDLAGTLDQAGNAAAQAVSGLLEEWGMDFFSPGGSGQMGSDLLDRLTQGGDPVAAITQVAVKPVVMTVLEIALFFLILTAVGLAVKLLSGVARGVNRIPLVGGLNRGLGLLCGAVYALLLGYILSSALLMLAGLGGGRWQYLNSAILRDTRLIRWFLGLRSYLPQ